MPSSEFSLNSQGRTTASAAPSHWSLPSCQFAARLAFSLGLLICLTGCERESHINYDVHGTLRAQHNGAGIGSAQIDWSEQIIDGGMLQGAAELIAEATTSENGEFQLSFERRQAYIYHLKAVSDSHFPLNLSFPPDDLRPDQIFELDLTAAPVCSISVRLHHTGLATAQDAISFRFGEDFDCVCCPPEERTWTGSDLDTTLTCAMHGDRWMTYWARVELPAQEVDSVWIDSTWCPAYGQAELVLNY